MSLHDSLRRLDEAILPDSRARRGLGGKSTVVELRDLELLLEEHARIDAQLRALHVLERPEGYPRRRDMYARVASDPGAYAGYKGERTMGRWIADALMAVERNVTTPLLLEVIERNWNAGPDAMVPALLELPDPGVQDFTPRAIAELPHEPRRYSARRWER